MTHIWITFLIEHFQVGKQFCRIQMMTFVGCCDVPYSIIAQFSSVIKTYSLEKWWWLAHIESWEISRRAKQTVVLLCCHSRGMVCFVWGWKTTGVRHSCPLTLRHCCERFWLFTGFFCSSFIVTRIYGLICVLYACSSSFKKDHLRQRFSVFDVVLCRLCNLALR